MENSIGSRRFGNIFFLIGSEEIFYLFYGGTHRRNLYVRFIFHSYVKTFTLLYTPIDTLARILTSVKYGRLIDL